MKRLSIDLTALSWLPNASGSKADDGFRIYVNRVTNK
jgi:hypothetical protein